MAVSRMFFDKLIAVPGMWNSPQLAGGHNCCYIESSSVDGYVTMLHFSSDLQQIIDQWDTLPEHIKVAIAALVESVGGKGQPCPRST